MAEFHVKRITLPSGKVVELVYLQTGWVETTAVEAGEAVREGDRAVRRDLDAAEAGAVDRR